MLTFFCISQLFSGFLLHCKLRYLNATLIVMFCLLETCFTVLSVSFTLTIVLRPSGFFALFDLKLLTKLLWFLFSLHYIMNGTNICFRFWGVLFAIEIIINLFSWIVNLKQENTLIAFNFYDCVFWFNFSQMMVPSWQRLIVLFVLVTSTNCLEFRFQMLAFFASLFTHFRADI